MKYAAIFLTLLLTACTVGPNYHRPVVEVPESFRTPSPLPAAEAESLADMKWFAVFKDESLQDLNITASATAETTRLSRNGSFALPSSFAASQDRTFGETALNLLSFEVDIWGRLRRSTEAARANLLAAEENRKAVVTTLVADLATNYFTLRELDYQLDIAQRTLATREQSLRLIQTRQAGGVGTLLDLRQGEQLVYTASATIPDLQQQIEQTENQISLLTASNPGNVARGRGLTEQELPPGVPAGLPSALLERRPDIRAAEERLVAANANIGVAKASYFPAINLTGLVSGQSSQLSSLFQGPNAAWNFAPQVSQPIFAGGRIKSGVRLAEAQKRAALAQYEKSIQIAFKEVSDALVAHQRQRESREEQENLVSALRDRRQLAYTRYQGGVDTLLNALDADRDLFQAELALSQTRLNELLSVV